MINMLPNKKDDDKSKHKKVTYCACFDPGCEQNQYGLVGGKETSYNIRASRL